MIYQKKNINKVKKDTILFVEDSCITKILKCLLTLKGEDNKVSQKIVQYRLQMHAHIGKVIAAWLILNNLTCERNLCNNIESGKGIKSMKTFTGYVFNDKN